MNRYTLSLKDLLWAPGTFEYVKVAEDISKDENYGAMLRIAVKEIDE